MGWRQGLLQLLLQSVSARLAAWWGSSPGKHAWRQSLGVIKRGHRGAEARERGAMGLAGRDGLGRLSIWCRSMLWPTRHIRAGCASALRAPWNWKSHLKPSYMRWRRGELISWICTQLKKSSSREVPMKSYSMCLCLLNCSAGVGVIQYLTCITSPYMLDVWGCSGTVTSR
jgi:hypothetical protein